MQKNFTHERIAGYDLTVEHSLIHMLFRNNWLGIFDLVENRS